MRDRSTSYCTSHNSMGNHAHVSTWPGSSKTGGFSVHSSFISPTIKGSGSPHSAVYPAALHTPPSRGQ